MSPAARAKLEELDDAFHGGGLSDREDDAILFELRVAGWAYPSAFSAPGALYVRWQITKPGHDELERLRTEEAIKP